MNEMAPDPMIGRRIGTAVIVELVGEGGMGAVYRAEHPYLKKSWAVKVILPELAQNRQAVDRFLNEARAAASVEHPRIVPVMDFGFTDDGRPYQVMPFLTGHDLNCHCQEVGAKLGHPGRIPLASVGNLYLQILDGIAAAHEHMIIHRDLKGSNIQVLDDGTVKILDFGVAKLLDEKLRTGQRTGTFQLLGSPGYLSPEQARGREVDLRTDIYALGVILFRMMTGRLPFEGDDLVDILAKALTSDPPTPSELVPEIPARLSAIVMECIARDPDDRPSSVRVLAHSLMDALPDGRAVALQVAPDLVRRSGPYDATVKPWAPLGQAAANGAGPSDNRPSPVAVQGTIVTLGLPDLRSPPPPVLGTSATPTPSDRRSPPPVEGTIWTIGPLDVPAPSARQGAVRTMAESGPRSRLPVARPHRPRLPRRVLAFAVILIGAVSGVAIVMITRGRSSEGANTQVSATGGPPRSSRAVEAVSRPIRVTESGIAAAGSPAGEVLGPTLDAGPHAGEAATVQVIPSVPASADPSKGASADRSGGEAPTGTGWLVIKAKPYAECIVDGKHVGSSPLTLTLPVGRHQLRLVRPDGTAESHRVTIRKNRATSITRNWNRLP